MLYLRCALPALDFQYRFVPTRRTAAVSFLSLCSLPFPVAIAVAAGGSAAFGTGGLNDGASSVVSRLVEPCDVLLVYSADAAAGRSMQVDASELKVKVSPDVLQMLSHMQQVGHTVQRSCTL